MVESIVLGIVQGVAEWLPVSSEGMIFLVKTNFFGGGSFGEMVKIALFLHLGTFAAAAVYFRRDLTRLTLHAFRAFRFQGESAPLFRFLVLSTVMSGGLGALLLYAFGKAVDSFEGTAPAVNLGIAALLLLTAAVQMVRPAAGERRERDLGIADGMLLGIAQALAVLPGLSRSGLTVSALLLRRMEDKEALRVSFLMSLPIVLGGNILLNAGSIALTLPNAAALAASFASGYATIHILLKVAAKISFSAFLIFFAGLLAVSALM